QSGSSTLNVFSRASDAGRARTYLDELLRLGRERTNPFLGRVLETTWHDPMGLGLRGRSIGGADRGGLVLPDRGWRALDRNVHGFFRALLVLESAGLARNRGLLLEGPPGTGKTAVCRVLARELEGCTVLFCDSSAVERSVRELYRMVAELSPALVVMED